MKTSDQIALTDLQCRYGDAVSRQAWDEVRALFASDCTLALALGRGDEHLDGADAIVGFVSQAVSGFDTFVFELMNAVVSADRTGRMWIHELRWSGGIRSDAYGLYEDTFTQGIDGLWRFASRRYTSISGGRFSP